MLALTTDPVQTTGTDSGNVVILTFGRKQTDGGKGRFMARRRLLFQQGHDCEMSMLQADGPDTNPSEMVPA